MRAIDGEDLELLVVNATHPARAVGGFAVPWRNIGIAEGGQTRFTGGNCSSDRERASWRSLVLRARVIGERR